MPNPGPGEHTERIRTRHMGLRKRSRGPSPMSERIRERKEFCVMMPQIVKKSFKAICDTTDSNAL